MRISCYHLACQNAAQASLFFNLQFFARSLQVYDLYYLNLLYTWPFCTSHVLMNDCIHQCHMHHHSHHNVPSICRLKESLKSLENETL